MKKLVALLAGVALASVAAAASATTYVQDTNLADFELPNASYATFTNFLGADPGISSPYTPTNANIAAGDRVFLGNQAVTGLPNNNNWILATFASAQNNIRVFDNIDHPDAYDAFEYQIWGSNDGTTWTQLFNPTSVTGSGPNWTLGTFQGTAPTLIDNVDITTACGPLVGDGCTGFISDYLFSTAYKDYAFGFSSVGFNAVPPNLEDELTAVGAVPEPGAWLLMIAGLGLVGAKMRSRRQAIAAPTFA